MIFAFGIKLLTYLTGFMPFLNGVLSYLQKRSDNATVVNTNAKDVAGVVVQAEVSRLSNMCQITVTAMSHPIYWVAWSLGVFPVLLYHACIFFVSTFPAIGWHIDKVPADQRAFALLVANWMFGIAGASTVVGAIGNAWAKRA